ncbi:conjugative transposon protein TraM [Hallella multisaccharivorax DSM 17128]|uniref:Conjugative transposon TraM protein n=1 Tax=Hallella multisaccharivorax DSM 17128 TaxID=688246 RepID=F8NBC4_9BACT|nr:conjugative transposon protein TraM [Hallella multisaccharivorax]EGN56881.1 conjugative transposon TraM protein [Hallella multisaccharivorax DSM 17128]GJG30425.1 conjugative transposon protein TraM [Hallella multisaccharivorax DSM 17128]
MNLQKLKRLNLRQPKYIFPLVIFLPLLGLIYFGMETFKGNGKTTGNVVTDSINMSIPDARGEGMDNKMTAMNKHFAEDGAFTAVDGIGDEYEQKDTTGSGYNDEERQSIDAVNAERLRQLKAEEDLRERQRANMNRINGYGSSGRSQQEDLNAYARELDRIQNRSMERQRQYQAEQDRRDKEEEAEERRQRQEMIDALTGNTRKKGKKEEKAEIVEKVKEDNSEKFNTVASSENVDEPLIKAMIDRTTKAREGTRLCFKLLDDVTVKGIRLKKGSYLYGIVTGFGQQRVKASITSILVGNKFIKVDLSVFDNDGMEGFYVPESTFREMVRDAGSNVAAQNIQFDVNGTGSLSPEIIALQALQNMYQSASSAVSKNIRKNKAKIKYNTIVYLINTQQD